MATYPATGRGAVCQFPLDRERAWRMVETESGGSARERRKEKGRTIVWRLRYEDLSDVEAMALEQFYVARRGGLEAFTFVDPLANALAGSENPGAAAWQGTGAGTVPAGSEYEGHAVLLMSSGQRLEQSVEVAAGLPYCASVWVRGGAGGRFRTDMAGNPVEITLHGGWQRSWAAMEAAGSDGVVPARFENTGAGAVEIAGLCVEAQAYPGEARASGGGKCLYRAARFGEGGMRVIPEGPNRNTVVVAIEATVEDEA